MFATWSLPESVAAEKTESIITRMKHYRFVQQHTLGDGTRIIPTLETMKHIFDSYDMFALPVAISEGSYTVFVN